MDAAEIPPSRRGRTRVQNMIDSRRNKINYLNAELQQLRAELTELLDKRDQIDADMRGGIDV